MGRELGGLSEAAEEPNPLDPFANEASNRLEQDLLMFQASMRPRTLLRRMARYKRYMNASSVQDTSLVLQWKERVNAAAAVLLGFRSTSWHGHQRRGSPRVLKHAVDMWPDHMPAVRGGVSVRRRLRFAPDC